MRRVAIISIRLVASQRLAATVLAASWCAAPYSRRPSSLNAWLVFASSTPAFYHHGSFRIATGIVSVSTAAPRRRLLNPACYGARHDGALDELRVVPAWLLWTPRVRMKLALVAALP